MATLSDWNYTDRNVQSGITEGQFISSSTTVLAAGPPFLTGASLAPPARQRDDLASPGSNLQSTVGDQVFLMGIVGQWSVNQQLAVVPVPEAGSQRSYTVTGPSSGQISIGRTLVHGPSLLRALYAHRRISDPRSAGGTFDSLINPERAGDFQGNPRSRLAAPAGYDNAWFDLSSDVFTSPFGLLILMIDTNREGYGACYLEQAHVNQHGFSSGPGSLVIGENIAATFARLRPVKLARAVPLLSKPENAGKIGIAATVNTVPGNAPTFLQVASQSNQ
jgi:hypothetical protein